MKLKFTAIAVFLSLFSTAQDNKDTIKLIARFIRPGIGSKIYIAKYEVIKMIKGTVTNNIIDVGYYFYKEYENAPDTALLFLKSYTGSSIAKDYYVFPEYDQKKGIEKVLISTIDFEYWEGCETGSKPCTPLTFSRTTKDIKWFLVMPCGGTSTSVTLTDLLDKSVIQTVSINASQCPPVFELTNLKDGKYYAYMLACGLGGGVEFRIKTIAH